jgi:hypothetical protein
MLADQGFSLALPCAERWPKQFDVLNCAPAMRQQFWQ